MLNDFVTSSDSKTDAGEEVDVCDRCEKFFKKYMPGANIAAIVLELEGDEKFAQDLDTAMTTVVAKRAEELKQSFPQLAVEHEVRSSVAVQDTFQLLTKTEVLETYGKTPKALRLRAVRLHDREHKSQVYF